MLRRSELEPVNIAILGLGTVGSGTYRVLQRNHNEISRRAGRDLNVYGAAVQNLNKKRDCDISHLKLTTDPFSLVEDPNVDIIVELIGGCTLAKDLILKAIEYKKHIVTANKALIAEHGNEIFSLAEAQGVTVAFEGAVAGGIPIIKTIREGLGANRIDWLAGIINGTCNYILTQMRDQKWDFNTALQSAQEKGYAESDPTFDIDGMDAAHKLTILASIAFGMPLQYSKVIPEGIRNLDPTDIYYASQLGYDIKHLGLAKRTVAGVELRVHPTLLPKNCLLAQVNGVMNAVVIHANAVGSTLYYGAGAGGDATASSVIADLVDIIRNMNIPAHMKVPYLAFQTKSLDNLSIMSKEEIFSAYYLRLSAKDEPGILAKVTQALGKRHISIKTIMQQPAFSQDKVPVIIVTHPVQEGLLNSALEEIKSCEGIDNQIVSLRLEDLILD